MTDVNHDEVVASVQPRKKRSRCPACQLQLCKSRREPPHELLKEVGRDAAKLDITYNCQTCGVVLTCSQNLAAPGWSQR